MTQYGRSIFVGNKIDDGYFLTLSFNQSVLLEKAPTLKALNVSNGRLTCEANYWVALESVSMVIAGLLFAALIIAFLIGEISTAFAILNQTIRSLRDGEIKVSKERSLVFKGITRRVKKAAEKYLSEQRIKIEETNKRIGAVSSARQIAHDSCASWDVVEVYTDTVDELLGEYVEHIDSSKLEAFKNVKHAVDIHASNVKAMMEELQDLNKIKSLDRKPIRIKQHILNIVNNLKQTIATPIKYDILIDDDLVVKADFKIVRVFLNLIKNGAEATGYKGHVWVKALPLENGLVHISVGNTGSHVPEEICKKMISFDGFTKGKENGHGLGLDIVKKILGEHGSKLSIISNELDNKTEFFFELERA